MKVSAPDATVWRISRRWVPWRRRVKGAFAWLPDIGYVSLGNDPISAVLSILLLIVLIPFVVLALVAGIELLLVAVILPFAILGRVLFGRHWIVEVRRGWQPYAEEQAGDWQASGLRIHGLADDLRRGVPPQQTIGLTDAERTEDAKGA